jgi:hypothetical protein
MTDGFAVAAAGVAGTAGDAVAGTVDAAAPVVVGFGSAAAGTAGTAGDAVAGTAGDEVAGDEVAGDVAAPAAVGFGNSAVGFGSVVLLLLMMMMLLMLVLLLLVVGTAGAYPDAAESVEPDAPAPFVCCFPSDYEVPSSNEPVRSIPRRSTWVLAAPQ